MLPKQLIDPMTQYQTDLETRGFIAHPSQLQAVECLQTLSEQLIQLAASGRPRRYWWSAWWSQAEAIQGVYFWGDVGRGKTYLMDMLYTALPFRKKMRSHYHEFMHCIHHALAKLPKQPNPLVRIAKDIADQAYVICLDEFHVLDITDAMLLSGLLEALFDERVVLVTTSNQKPGDLYEDGLQRSAFLPAIALLEAHTQVLHLGGEVDYRRRYAAQFPCYHAPYSSQVEAQLQREFSHLSAAYSLQAEKVLEVHKRCLQTRYVSGQAVWFDFAQICMTARSSSDYLTLAKRYRIFFISDIPILGEHNNDASMRFIRLIDALYDHHNWVVLAAEVPLEALYVGRSQGKIFRRVVSRIHEMQSDQYRADCQLSHIMPT